MFFIVTLTCFTPCSSVSIVNFEQVNAGWEMLAGQKLTGTGSVKSSSQDTTKSLLSARVNK